MSELATSDSPAMTTPPIRLAFGALLWRVFLVIAVMKELQLWNRLRPFLVNKSGGFRVAVMILKSPSKLFAAFVLAAVITVILDLYVRLIMRPLMARWYAPKRGDAEFGTPLTFRLDSNERILDEIPARLVSGRTAQPGTLVRTDRRLWFSPRAWDQEPWSIASARIAEVATRPAPIRFGSLILGTPDRLVVRDDSGAESLFVVSDPLEVLALFPDRATYPVADYEPSPLELL
jgi:hypothetical protein